ncbi:microfibril-associated glycoprotein 4-like isoform X2 [Dendropsophus ebraccatus]|uniref:microfibril-associated glycoprotein 4-like isoform X2 n=1 Tax=Dendropsophus ebraccatus TaxID=150705 RepID=UPI0038316464
MVPEDQLSTMKIFLFLVLCHIQQITGVWSNTQPAPQQKTEVDGIPIDCQDVWDNGQPSSGVYIIYPQGAQRPLPVYCDMTTAGMVWTVFQRRLDGSVRFDRSWQDYVNGFGIADGEYWLGLQNIYRLTMFSDYELQVELEDSEGTWVWAKGRPEPP